MPELLTCRSGHQWEPSPETASACPVCGSGIRGDFDPHVTIDLQPGEPPPIDEAESEPDYQPQIPGYKVLKQLARGGGGMVYQALHEGCNRLVALKVLFTGSHPVEARVERFRREARLLARLDHPNVVPVYDAGESWNRLYHAMKHLGGGSLRQRMPAVTAVAVRAIELFVKLAEAVHYIHGRGVVHCDVKPANVLFDGAGEPYLCDFGTARSVEEGPADDMTRRVLGTPAYMAPEQTFDAGVFGPATDVYALGVILYEMLTGQLPFQATSSFEMLRMTRDEEPEPPRSLNLDCPEVLEQICLRRLRKEPEARPTSARELADQVREFMVRTADGARLLSGGSWFLDRPNVVLRGEAPDEQDTLLRAGVDSMTEGVLVVDATGKVVRSNPAAATILGRDLTGLSLPDWLHGQHWLRGDAVTPLPVQGLPLAAALRGETADEVETFLLPGERPWGGWLVLSARPLAEATGASGAVVVLRDITALKGTLGSGRLYHSLMSLLGLNVFRKDVDGRYTFVNRLFCDNVGRPPERILGCTDFDLFSADLSRQAAAKEELVRDSGVVVEFVEEHTPTRCQPGCRCMVFREPQALTDRQEDEARYFQMLLAPLHDDGRRVVGVQGAFWNITARRRAERQLEQTAEALEQANAELARSNAELEQFAYAASHDLQEPLRMVASFTQLLQRRYQGRLDEEADKFIHFAVDGATRMQRLINDLLAYSRVNRGGPPINVISGDEAFDRAVQNLREAVRETGAVVTRGPLPKVRGDATQLMQVFQNLIGNAIKFRGSARPAIHVAARRDAERSEWVVTVQDNGIGIEPRHLERIFVIFQRLHTQQEYPGSGIGLAISRKIVERHGGRIWAESEPGKGSMFCFTLPVV